VLSPSIILEAADQTWPPFVLVVGLLLIGQAASADGLFEALADRISRAPLSPRALLIVLLALVAAVTAVLNLDTSVVFLTPVVIHAARRRGLDERPFLYGAVFMSNSASLLLPGSNLTNLLVLHSDHVTGAVFAARMLPAWLVACALTAALLALIYPTHNGEHDRGEAPPLRLGLGAAATLAAATLVLVIPNPALPVLAIGVGTALLGRTRAQLDTRVLGPLFASAVALGTLARAWHGPADLLHHIGPWPTAGAAALTSIMINNLPAAVLLSTQPPPHPRALLLGLDLGPNLAVTGSLSAYLWLKAARSAGAHPSIRTYSALGLLLVPLTLTGALGALAVFAPNSF
jgi:arsenical pump membrane protein